MARILKFTSSVFIAVTSLLLFTVSSYAASSCDRHIVNTTDQQFTMVVLKANMDKITYEVAPNSTREYRIPEDVLVGTLNCIRGCPSGVSHQKSFARIGYHQTFNMQGIDGLPGVKNIKEWSKDPCHIESVSGKSLSNYSESPWLTVNSPANGDLHITDPWEKDRLPDGPCVKLSTASGSARGERLTLCMPRTGSSPTYDDGPVYMNLGSAPGQSDFHYKVRTMTCSNSISSVDFIDGNREDANGNNLRTNVPCDIHGHVTLPASSAGKATGIRIIPKELFWLPTYKVPENCVRFYADKDWRGNPNMLQLCDDGSARNEYLNLGGSGPKIHSHHHAVKHFQCGPGIETVEFINGNKTPWARMEEPCGTGGGNFTETLTADPWVTRNATGVSLFKPSSSRKTVTPETTSTSNNSNGEGPGCEYLGQVASQNGGDYVTLMFSNTRSDDTQIYWINGEGLPINYSGVAAPEIVVPPVSHRKIRTRIGHVFAASDSDRKCLGAMRVSKEGETFFITDVK